MNRNYLDVVYTAAKLERGDYTYKLATELKNRFLTVNPSEKKKFLDIGCGKGMQALAFSDWFEISGIDLSTDAQKIFNAHGKSIDIHAADLETGRYPFDDATFDVIFSKSVIEHLANTDHFLGEVMRILKPGGIVIMMAPAWESQHKHFYDDYTHIKPFTRLGLKSAMKISGFNDVRVSIFYQLPFIWRIPALKILCYLIALLPDRLKWIADDRTRPRKLIRFSKETMLLGVGKK